METSDKPKENKTLLYIGAGLFAAVLAGGAYYFFTRPKSGNNNFSGEENDTIPGNTSIPPAPGVYNPPALPPSGGATSGGDSFPLRRGSRGPRVKQLQEILIKKYGSSILPRFGADGDFGGETESALRSRGIPTVISEQDFTNYFGQAPASSSSLFPAWMNPDPTQNAASEASDKMATALAKACTFRKADEVLKILQGLKSVQDYSSVNEYFKKKPVGFLFQKYTIVEATLSFFGEEDKKKFRAEFLRMGLKYDSVNQRWSLSGFAGGQRVETLTHARVWNSRGSVIHIPAKVNLGWLVRIREGIAEIFTLNGKKVFVSADQIRISA